MTEDQGDDKLQALQHQMDRLQMHLIELQSHCDQHLEHLATIAEAEATAARDQNVALEKLVHRLEDQRAVISEFDVDL